MTTNKRANHKNSLRLNDESIAMICKLSGFQVYFKKSSVPKNIKNMIQSAAYEFLVEFIRILVIHMEYRSSLTFKQRDVSYALYMFANSGMYQPALFIERNPDSIHVKSSDCFGSDSSDCDSEKVSESGYENEVMDLDCEDETTKRTTLSATKSAIRRAKIVSSFSFHHYFPAVEQNLHSLSLMHLRNAATNILIHEFTMQLPFSNSILKEMRQAMFAFLVEWTKHKTIKDNKN